MFIFVFCLHTNVNFEYAKLVSLSEKLLYLRAFFIYDVSYMLSIIPAAVSAIFESTNWELDTCKYTVWKYTLFDDHWQS